MRNLPYKILNTFGLSITKEEYLTTMLVHKEKGKKVTYFNIKDVVYGLADGDYTTLFMMNGKKYVFCTGFKIVCTWFQDNFFDCYYRGEFINTSMILKHTGKYKKVVSLFLPMDWISVVAKSQRSRFLDGVNKSIIIIDVTKALQRILNAWKKKGRAIRIGKKE